MLITVNGVAAGLRKHRVGPGSGPSPSLRHNA